MATLMQASNQWMSRPADERFTSLTGMQEHFKVVRDESQSFVTANKRITLAPTGLKEMVVEIEGAPIAEPVAPTHHAFGQLAQLVGAPAGYLRNLPAPIAADAINYGLKFSRPIDDVGVLTRHNGEHVLRAATGPRYGRIWNADVIDALVNRFGDGVTGHWRVPGEFGKAVTIDKDNTTFYASDKDMFVFLADETRRIEMPNRRDGKPGSLARGFFVWNSEVGDKRFGLGTFLFDYVCMNRIVWGAEHYDEVTIRHTASAPDKFLEQMQPALTALANASDAPIREAVAAAQAKKLDDDLDDFLANRFGKRMVAPLKALHEAEEARPIETLWDVSTAATAFARSLPNTDKRVEMEREAGKVLKLAA
jgi:hypothetical protein